MRMEGKGERERGEREKKKADRQTQINIDLYRPHRPYGPSWVVCP